MNLVNTAPLFAAAVTLVIGLFTAVSAGRARRDANSVATRTVSLDEMEKALVWTGNQLSDLRLQVGRQADKINDLERHVQECERDKRRLDREIGELRNGGGR